MVGKMKRWLMAMCVISLAGASLAACGKKEEPAPEPAAEVTETPEPTQEEKIGKLITKANDEETLVEKYGSLAMRTKIHMKDDTVGSVYLYRSEDYFYLDQDGSFFVDDAGDVYGYNSENETPEYRCLFVDDGYKEFQENYEEYGWTKDDEDAAALSGEAEDGMLTVEVAEDLTEDLKAMIEEQGYQASKSGKLRSVYTVDEVSYEISEVKIYYVGKNGKETLLQEVSMLFDEKKPEVEQAYMDRVFSDDFRKVQVIVDPGSAKEQTYTQTVGKGCSVLMVMPESFEQTLYQDAACTKEWQTGNSDLEADCVLYALSSESGHEIAERSAKEAEAAAGNTADEVTLVESTEEGDSDEVAQCPTCGRRFSVEENNGTSEFQQHMELEDRLATAKEHLDDQTPLEVVDENSSAKQCSWCQKWYSTESADGSASDYESHVQWEKEYETVYNSLN